jgi:hypothetical protein
MPIDVPEDRCEELLLGQYKLYVETAESVTSRRIDASKFYVTLLTALLAVIPFALSRDIPASVTRFVFLAIGASGIALCTTWMFSIHSYRQLNKLKFKVIDEMEERLPFACFRREWELLKQYPEEYKYRRIGVVELAVPIILLVIYTGEFVYALLLKA